ncbi:DUF6603 domain-containing protein [Streptomyces sp. NPDC053542]|uniref:DUF6603 domain-containing protein n=1 Tax=Streptomyces sp. NPDC053542 TaxID=3365710 RepID=UPI0037D84BEA
MTEIPADGGAAEPGEPASPDTPQGPADGQSALVTEILRLIEPVTEAVANPLRLARLLARIGWNPAAAGEQGAAEVADWLEDAAGAVGVLQELVAHPPQDLEGLGRLLEVVAGAVDLVRDVPPALGDFDAEAFAEDVVHFLVTDWLLRHHSVLYHVLVLLGVLVLPEEAGPQTPVVNQDGEEVRTAAARARLRPERLVELVTDPVAALRAAYLPDGLVDEAAADALAATLLPRLGGLLHELGVSVLVGLGETADTGLDDASVALGRRMLTLGIPVAVAPGIGGEIGATLALSSPASGDLGVVVVPRGKAAVDQLLGGGWALRADLSGAGPAVAIGPQGVSFTAHTAGRIELGLELRKAGEKDAPALLLGSATGTRLEIGQFRTWLKAVLEDVPEGAEDRNDIELGIAADKAAFVVAGGDGDGFLASVLPAEGLRTEFALGLQWSRRKGLSFTGSAGLDATLPVNARLGPIELQAIHLGLGADATEGELRATVAATARLELGPVRATVERIGLGAELTTSNGNLGPVGLSAAFAPPKGAALEVAAGPVTGGGYLFFDRDKQEYAGVLALQLESIALKAVGLLTTKMPDGSEGFSLLVLVSAEFTPVQLGFGFTLSGVGGLIGINRSVSVDTLRAGVRTKALDSVLFPRDPLARAPEIVATLGAVFPPTPGRHVVGPMARIGWGTPTLLTLDLGLLLELPTPVRLVLLGRLRMALPTEETALVVVNMDVLGVIDFERGEASVDATLYDSRIAAFALTGDMAMRARWKGRPQFALSAGGFHPRFQRPEGFPELRRLNLSLLNGDNPRVRLEAYLALTSNTAQFGARLELYAAALGFSVEGLLAFDALVQFEPFGFEVDIAGHLALKRGSRTLMGVGVEVALSGPAPWHVRGRARFEILFFSGEISFDRTFGERAAPAALPAAVDVAVEVEKALADPRNWTAQLTGAGRTVVTLRELPDAEGQLIVHPLGGLACTQRVAPLGVTLDRYGSAPVDGDRRLDLDPVLTVEDADPATAPVTVRMTPTREYFAPAQFLDLTDEQKLAAPSFELLTAGASAEGAVARKRERAGVFASSVGYEEIVQDGAHRVTAPAGAAAAFAGPGPAEGPALGAAGLRTAAAPAARRTGRQRFAAAPRDLGVRDTRWRVSGEPGETGLLRSAAPRGTTWTEAAEYRRDLATAGLRLAPETAPGDPGTHPTADLTPGGTR